MSQQEQKLLLDHQAILDASGISPDIAESRAYRSMSSKYAQEELLGLDFSRAQARIPGLLIPLYGIDGNVAGYQYRPDTPRVKEGKPIKYESPKGQRNILDIPPTVHEAVRSARQAIFITEGARKADALATLGIPAINISGVYGWRGKNKEGGITALADWEDISIKDNIFVLAFDSDILTKPQVHQALSRLKAFLEGRAAKKVRVLVLPQLLTGKTGIDDFIYETNATVKDLAKLIVDELPSTSENQDQEEANSIEIPPLSELLDSLVALVRQFMVLSNHQLTAIALWIVHTHAL